MTFDLAYNMFDDVVRSGVSIAEPALKAIGRLQLSPPKRLKATSWLKAIAYAQSCSKMAREMLNSPLAWKDASKDDEELRQIIDAVQTPGGDLLALFMLIRRGHKLRTRRA